MYWDDKAIDNFIASYYPWFLPKFRSYPYGIQRADTFRYFVLYHYGGIYSDFDNVPTREFFTEWYEQYKHEQVILPLCRPGGAFANQDLTNYFLCSEPKHTFWIHVWNLLYNPLHFNQWKKMIMILHYFYVLETTGPGIISDSYHSLNPTLQHQIHLTSDLHHDKYIKEIYGSTWYESSIISTMMSKLANINPTKPKKNDSQDYSSNMERPP